MTVEIAVAVAVEIAVAVVFAVAVELVLACEVREPSRQCRARGRQATEKPTTSG